MNSGLQKSKEMIAMGITGPEGHEMCRPEEVGHADNQLFVLVVSLTSNLTLKSL